VNAAPIAGRHEPRANILIVDDLHEKHVVFRSILEELGQNIVSAHSGREALAKVLDNEFAVILLDINMPDMDGLETAGLIRQHKRSAQTPIVFITAYVDEFQARRGYELGAVDYIPSPVVAEVLRSKVRVFVELHRMHKQLQLRAAEREALAREQAARAAAEAAKARADFLGDSGRQLSRSLDMAQTLQALLQVCVPRLADAAAVVAWAGEGPLGILRTHPAAEAGAWPESLAHVVRQSSDPAKSNRWAAAGGEATGRARAHALVFALPEGESGHQALVLFSSQPQDAQHTALAAEVASRAAIALDNARLYAAVQQADRRKNEFLAMLAHELRNPLAPIRNAVHIMQDPGIQAATLSWARDVISRQADHMTRLIDDLLDVSRIVQGKVTIRPEPLPLAALFERVVEDSTPRLAVRKQKLHIRMPREDVLLQGDPVRLAQVLSNLIQNSAKFSPPGSTIDLSADYREGELTLRVRDTGCGIEADFLPHIFELFVQGDQSLDRAQGGLGIGLTLVKHVVELHHGRVEAFSAGVGQGTEIVCRLPARAQDADSSAPHGPAPKRDEAPPDRHGRRILVVDDLPASAETLTLLFEMEGYQVAAAGDGPTALKLAAEFQPHVLVLDIGLPGMNGFEVAERLRAGPGGADLLIIALTGYGEAESRERSAAAGFDHHMVKPADVQQLLALVAQASPQGQREKIG
jgi:signal transduction histidine kinase/DNA-binding response OmpR family regulator